LAINEWQQGHQTRFEAKKKNSLFYATSLFSEVVGGSCLGVGSICFQIIDVGLSSMIENREQIQRTVVQLVLHNVVKGGMESCTPQQ
jgi:hypothetical protein